MREKRWRSEVNWAKWCVSGGRGGGRAVGRSCGRAKGGAPGTGPDPNILRQLY